MKTPAFWKTKNTISTLLLPLANFYDTASTLYRAYTRPVKLPVPVICIGNITAGGSGKTPVAMHIGELLKQKNVPAFFLSRGYGGKLKGPVLVDAKKHTARDVGDEPLLLAEYLPTVVARNRIDGGLLAIQKGAKAIIMDDGFQNPSLAKSLSLMVIDGKIGLGNNRLLPAGPLRESLQGALRRTHAVIVLNRSTLVPALPSEKPVFTGITTPGEKTLALRDKKIIAFCGIAYPQKFFGMLSTAGAKFVDTISFPDHYNYKPSDIKKLLMRAHNEKSALVTTAKDAVRLPVNAKEYVYVADMAVEFDNPAGLNSVLDYIMNQYEKN